MNIPTIKLAENLEVPKMGIGTWGVGGYMKKSPYNDDENDVAQIKYQIEKGLTLVDTWLAQADGNMVDIVAKAIDGLPRNNYQIVAKLDVKNFVAKKDVEKTVNQFLDKLKIDFVDVLQIHKPTWIELSAQETISEMDRMVDIGKVKHLAISNANVDLLKDAIKFTKNKFLFNEVNFSVIDRTYQTNGTTDFCLENNIKIMSYKPLARGMTNYLSGIDGLPLFKDLSTKYNCTTNQVALNWLLSKPNFLAWVKSVNRSHINENLDCMSFEMTAEEHQQIDEWKFV